MPASAATLGPYDHVSVPAAAPRDPRSEPNRFAPLTSFAQRLLLALRRVLNRLLFGLGVDLSTEQIAYMVVMQSQNSSTDSSEYP
jgi:hypothetical protein